MTLAFARRLRMVFLGAMLVAAAWARAQTPAIDAASEASGGNTAMDSSTERLFEQARRSLVQVRVLLKSQSSQASVGSGFFAAPNRILTNYHVVSQYALDPDRYQLTYRLADGREGPLNLLAIDVRHDLAVVRLSGNSAVIDNPSLGFRPHRLTLAKGEPIFSMGNPLDVGFAVVSGTYNGLVERSYYPNIFFGGALNAGMSGGPAVDGLGRVIGVNVATRRDGQQVSFLVPAVFAEDILQRSMKAVPMQVSAYPEITRQLMAHQDELTQRFLHMPWRSAGDSQYFIPLPQEEFMRCWGSGTSPESKGLQFQRSDCVMDSGLYINNSITIVPLNVRHESYDGTQLGALRFAREYSQSMRNESLANGRATTPMQCAEQLVDNRGLPLRSVICLAAYKKLKGLYNASVLVATNDRAVYGLLGRFDIQGVSLTNALALSRYYIEGFARLPNPPSLQTEHTRPSHPAAPSPAVLPKHGDPKS